jgi:transposase
MLDADLNASLNIAANLIGITKQERLLHRNRKGFYWLEVGKEFIVPSTQKPNCNNI